MFVTFALLVSFHVYIEQENLLVCKSSLKDHNFLSITLYFCGSDSELNLCFLYKGCTGGLGSGVLLPNGLSSGAGHGGRGGDAYYNGSYIRGGISYGNIGLPCELGSGSGNHSLPSSTAGGGIIG